jgi:hypothetical protein
MLVAGIFVSYSRESEAAVRALAQDVEALEHTVWFDRDLSGGKVWWEQILAEIRDCQVFMMALSPDSLRSVACSSEYNYASELGKPILPILIADGVSPNLLPPKLSQIQFVDYRKPDQTGAHRPGARSEIRAGEAAAGPAAARRRHRWPISAASPAIDSAPASTTRSRARW